MEACRVKEQNITASPKYLLKQGKEGFLLEAEFEWDQIPRARTDGDGQFGRR